MDGVEASKQILKRSRDDAMPQVVFLSAHVTDNHRKECLQAGAVGFLSKPYNLDELTDCLRDVAFHKPNTPKISLPEGPVTCEDHSSKHLHQSECSTPENVCLEV